MRQGGLNLQGRRWALLLRSGGPLAPAGARCRDWGSLRGLGCIAAIFSADPLYCYLSLGDTLLLSIHTHNDTTQRHSYTNLCWTTTTTQLNDTSCPCTTKTFGHYKTSKVEMNATANDTSKMNGAGPSASLIG